MAVLRYQKFRRDAPSLYEEYLGLWLDVRCVNGIVRRRSSTPADLGGKESKKAGDLEKGFTQLEVRLAGLAGNGLSELHASSVYPLSPLCYLNSKYPGKRGDSALQVFPSRSTY